MTSDFTRWNRAGLTRFEYVDGNAITFLDLLREKLNQGEYFPNWEQTHSVIPENESNAELNERQTLIYQQSPDDMLWHLTRSFARSCHVLTEHINAYANEASLGTATQWENIRKLVAMLDYTPQPPASAYTPLALMVKENLSGTVHQGFQVKHASASGEQIVFETLSDLDVHHALNELRPYQHSFNKTRLRGSDITVEGLFEKLSAGTPFILESLSTGITSAHIIQGIYLNKDLETTKIYFTPSLSREFVKGDTQVHLLPKESLQPIGPATLGAVVSSSLQLTASTGDLLAGEIMAIGVGDGSDKKTIYRRIKNVRNDRLIFTTPLGETQVKSAVLSRAIRVPITDIGDEPIRIITKLEPSRKGEGTASYNTKLYVVYVAGDWSWLLGRWVSHLAIKDEVSYLPLYRVQSVNYKPVTPNSTSTDKSGYTALTLEWSSETDGTDSDLDFSLNNPQYLFSAPRTPGPWHADVFLEKPKGVLSQTLAIEATKHTATNDFAVVLSGRTLSWCQLEGVDQIEDYEYTEITAREAWQQKGGGQFYLTKTLVYSHFTEIVKIYNWNQNFEELEGDQVILELSPSELSELNLTEGRSLILNNGNEAIQTFIKSVESTVLPVPGPSPQLSKTLNKKTTKYRGKKMSLAVLILQHRVPNATTVNNLKINANVVMAGHGAIKSTKVLGSGDASVSNQQFVLAIENVSWVADALQSSGVRAATQVKVNGAMWQQVSNLKDSSPTDMAYSVRLNENGFLIFHFGDGIHGRRLPTGSNNVQVSYRTGVGASGNLNSGSLEKPVKPHQLIEAVAQPVESVAGAAGEAIEDIKLNAPATLLSLGRAVSIPDFGQLARSHASVWQARAFSQPSPRARRDQIDVVVVPAEGVTLSQSLKGNLQDFIISNSVPGISVAVKPYEAVTVAIHTVIRVDESTYNPDQVKEQVVAALQQAFHLNLRQLGQALYRGEIFKVVEGITGVANSTCTMKLTTPITRLDKAPEIIEGNDSEIRLIRIQDNQCLHLDLNRPEVTVEQEAYVL